MAWIAVATIGGAIFGGVLASKSSGKDREASERASVRAGEASEAELDFAKEQYADWEETYGGLEDNLAEYYSSITPDFIETQGLEAFELEKDRALKNVREVLSQRGIGTSGLAGAAEISSEITGASERAKIRAEAPMKAAQEKASFLQVGLGQDPSGNIQSSLTNSANRATNIARDARSDAVRSRGDRDTAIGTAISTSIGAATDFLQTRKDNKSNSGDGS